MAVSAVPTESGGSHRSIGSRSGRTSGSRGWLFGLGPDLVLGCGVGSMAVMAIQAVMGPDLARHAPGALLILLFAIPHYGATLIRAYEDPADRRRYRFFSSWATVLVASAFAASLYDPFLGSLVLTLYLTWSPWHYTGQNYGVAVMLLARRGAPPSAVAKRILHASFLLSFVLTFFAIHGARPQSAYAPVSYGGTVFELLPIGFPQAFVGVAISVVGVAYLATVIASVFSFWRAGRMLAALPCLVLMGTQALWFSVPVPVRFWELAPEASVFQSVYTPYGFLWIAGWHSLQYLWITTYFATEQGRPSAAMDPGAARRAGARLRFLGKAALLGYAVWTLPALLFAPGLLGRLPHESGLALMVAATVNLHHFLLDGAVWKLRDGRVARVLLGGPAAPPRVEAGPAAAGRFGPSWLRRTIYALGAVCLAYGALTYWLDDFGFARAMSRGDLARAERALEQLSWLGRDGPGRRTELGRRLAREGRSTEAGVQIQRGLALQPTARGWQSLGLLHEEAGEWQAAATAYDSALTLEARDSTTMFRAGRAWLEGGRPDLAVERLERAAAMEPGKQIIARTLTRARREREEWNGPVD